MIPFASSEWQERLDALHADCIRHALGAVALALSVIGLTIVRWRAMQTRTL